MRFGNHLRLFTLGAVLAFAVHVDLDVVQVATVGRILMLAAAVGAGVDLLLVLRSRAVRPAAPASSPGLAAAAAPAAPARSAWTTERTRPFTPRVGPHQQS